MTNNKQYHFVPWSYISPNLASMNMGYITQSIIRQTKGRLSPLYRNAASSLISSVITAGSDFGFKRLIGIISKPYWCLPETFMSFQVRLHNFCILSTKSLNTLLSHPFKEVFISKYLKQKRGSLLLASTSFSLILGFTSFRFSLNFPPIYASICVLKNDIILSRLMTEFISVVFHGDSSCVIFINATAENWLYSS